MKKLLIADGNSMLFRAYYATAYGMRMSTKEGIPTNAVFGFANMLQKAIDIVNPDSILVAFDAGKHTFRHDLYEDYKGGRKPAPDDLVPQFQLARDYLDGYHIPWVEMEDIEADDLIGSMSRQALDYSTSILSSDHDLLQLIDDSTSVILMKKGISEVEVMDKEKLKEEMGITPAQIIDLKGLMGDHSDNIPGIPGIGEKTALKLLGEYGDVETVLEHAEELKGATGRKVKEGKDLAVLSKKLATIRTDVPLSITAEECAFDPDYESLIRFLESLDMRAMAKRYKDKLAKQKREEAKEESAIEAESPEEKPEVPEEPEVLEESEAAEEAEDVIAVEDPHSYHLAAAEEDLSFFDRDLAVFVSDERGSFRIAGIRMIAFSDGKESRCYRAEEIQKDKALAEKIAEHGQRRIGFDFKRAMHLLKKAGITIPFSDDAMIAANLADSTLTSEEKIFEHFALSTTESYEDIYGTEARPKLAEEEREVRYSCEKARLIFLLDQRTKPMIKEEALFKLYRDIELPLASVLFEMEEIGIRCEAQVLKEIASDIQQKITDQQKKIYEYAGREFNLNSPKQLGEVLYDELGLPTGKKRSTSADVLEKLIGMHPIVEELMAYRKYQKIYSTYAEGLQKYISDDGRIHTVFNQCVTQTGRLSSSDPNLQNISVRDELGRIIRKAFLPDEGHVLLSSDYHQIELRMLASMADEESMIDAFNNDIDIHTKTAMDVFGVSQEEVTPEMRRRAKTVNFGIVYGISDFGLGEQLGISRREAADFIRTYYEKYPRIRTYMDSLVKFCEKNGYVLTLCGRRRLIPEIHDRNRMVREFGKRAAMNAPIQGSAADLIKIAMIDIDKKMKEAKVKSRMLLQVHDELIFDVPKEEEEIMKQLVRDGMIHAMSLKVPLTVEISLGNNWYEAK